MAPVPEARARQMTPEADAVREAIVGKKAAPTQGGIRRPLMQFDQGLAGDLNRPGGVGAQNPWSAALPPIAAAGRPSNKWARY
jgi:hypothetical protein